MPSDTYDNGMGRFGERGEGAVHLVGSVPRPTNEEAFASVAATLGDRIVRLPDGETGSRSDWIAWQYPVLLARPEFAVCPVGDHPYRSFPRLRLVGPNAADSLRFDGLGYAQAASDSYRTFTRLQSDGLIAEHVRFQVCLPTPLAPIVAFVAPEHQAGVESAYERAMQLELEQILATIPHERLAIQWDANFEFALLGGLVDPWFSNVRSGVVERLCRLASAVPSGVELGFHFCHDHERLRHDEPYDARHMVEVANALVAASSRPLDWLHLPVPPDRVDVGFFEKLAPLELSSGTDLYLGLVHLDQGEMGVAARITAARRFLPHFGIATACGWGRHAPGDFAALMHLHASADLPLSNTSKGTTG